MTATGSATVSTRAGAGTVPGGAPSRAVLNLARVEALFLVRSPLVLAGLVSGLVTIWAWFWLNPVQPMWWVADWRIGGAQLILAMTVLFAAQLAAGRPRRDGMADLYASFPATAGTRTAAHLAGLAGVLPASLVLAGAGVVLVQLRHPIGTPSAMVLFAGVVLVLAAGAIGTPIGTRFPHPLAGLLSALALYLLVFIETVLPGSAIWLMPWHLYRDELGWIPGPLAGYPPAGLHAAYLASGAVLAATVALALSSRGARARVRALLTAAGAVGAAGLCLTGVLQARPVPVAELNHLAAEMAAPVSAQQCTTASQVRYCVFPGFGPDLSQIEAPVSDVLTLLPARPGPLTVEQVLDIDFNDPHLTYGYAQQQIQRWNAAQLYAPGNIGIPSVIGLTVGQWPGSGNLTDADFQVALAAAEWAVRFRPLTWDDQCVPLDQAREAISIWLAILAAHPSAGKLGSGLHGAPVVAGHTPVNVWRYAYSYQLTLPGPQLTAAGYLLAKAMTGVPEQKVRQVLTDGWAAWLNPRTTDAQLASALGIKLPNTPTPVRSTDRSHLQLPVCTS
jgi:hypothetical protein